MDAKEGRVPRWMFGAAVAVVVLTLTSVQNLSMYKGREALSLAHRIKSASQPRLGPRPAASPPVVDRSAARVTPVVARRSPVVRVQGRPNGLVDPAPQPAEALTFPLAGLAGEGDYDPAASLPALDLLRPIAFEVGVEPVDGSIDGLSDKPVDLDGLVAALLTPKRPEIVVLRPGRPRWRAGSAANRWRVFGFDGGVAAERIGRLAATAVNAGQSQQVAATDYVIELAADWAPQRLASGVIHSPPAMAGAVLTGPGDRLAMAVSAKNSAPTKNSAPAGGDAGSGGRVASGGTVPLAISPNPRAGEAGLATPTTLLGQVRQLMAEPATSTWAMRVEVALDAALAVRPTDVEGFARASLELRRLALEGSDLAELVDSPSAAVLLRRACYGIFRRLAAWDLAVRIESRRIGVGTLGPPPVVGYAFGPPGDDRWQAIARCLSGRPTGVFSCAYRDAIDRPRVITLEEMHARERRPSLPSVPPLRLVNRLEAYERNRGQRLASLVARDLQELHASDEPSERRLGEQVAQQYRNANVRLAVAGELLERLLPGDAVQTTRLNDRVLGARVSGVARTESELSLQLSPDEGAWRVGLEAVGRVTTRTESVSGPVVVHSRGVTRFTATKTLSVDADGVRQGAARCRATNKTRLVSVDSSLDTVPLVRRVLRNRANDRFQASQSRLRQRAEQQVEDRVARSIDQGVADLVDGLRERYTAGVVGRADRLGLRVTPVEVRTTEQRLIARLRLAADDQLGSHTPRTRAPSDSLASVQLHESALNNAAEGLGLAGERFTAEALLRRLADQLLAPSLAETEGDSEASRIVLRFAEEQPLSIAFDDGAARLALAIAEMRVGGSRYRNFRVHATYEPQPVGAAAIVRRTGAIEIEGRLRTTGRLKLHGVFARVLSDDQPITLLSPPEGDRRFDGLMITQMVMDDGWLGVALGPASSAAIPNGRVAVAGRYLR